MQEKRYAVVKIAHNMVSDGDEYSVVNYLKRISTAREAAKIKKGNKGDIFIVLIICCLPVLHYVS